MKLTNSVPFKLLRVKGAVYGINVVAYYSEKLLIKLDFKVGFYKSNYTALGHFFWLIKNVFHLA